MNLLFPILLNCIQVSKYSLNTAGIWGKEVKRQKLLFDNTIHLNSTVDFCYLFLFYSHLSKALAPLSLSSPMLNSTALHCTTFTHGVVYVYVSHACSLKLRHVCTCPDTSM